MVRSQRLLCSDLRLERIQIPVLDEVEEHLDWSQLEVVRSEVESGHFVQTQPLLNIQASMIHGVVEHQHRVLSPTMIFTIEMVDKFPYEVTK